MFMYYYGSCDILYRNGQCFCLRRDSLVRNRNSCPGSGSRADFIRAGIRRDASRTSGERYPTISNTGIPMLISTSTCTGIAQIPSSMDVLIWLYIFTSFQQMGILHRHMHEKRCIYLIIKCIFLQRLYSLITFLSFSSALFSILET